MIPDPPPPFDVDMSGLTREESTHLVRAQRSRELRVSFGLLWTKSWRN